MHLILQYMQNKIDMTDTVQLLLHRHDVNACKDVQHQLRILPKALKDY